MYRARSAGIINFHIIIWYLVSFPLIDRYWAFYPSGDIQLANKALSSNSIILVFCPRHQVHTLAFLHVPRTPAPSITSPPRTTSSRFRNTSVTFPDRGHLVPTPGLGENACTGPLCRFLAEWLRHSIDYTVDPCKDFYKYVCASFKGTDTLKHVRRPTYISSLLHHIFYPCRRALCV